jgi:hypothetical protein
LQDNAHGQQPGRWPRWMRAPQNESMIRNPERDSSLSRLAPGRNPTISGPLPKGATVAEKVYGSIVKPHGSSSRYEREDCSFHKNMQPTNNNQTQDKARASSGGAGHLDVSFAEWLSRLPKFALFPTRRLTTQTFDRYGVRPRGGSASGGPSGWASP